MEPKVLRNIENRNLKKNFLGIDFNYPFVFATMGMCNLTWPGADIMLAEESVEKIMQSISKNHCEIILPDDFIISDSFSEKSNIQTVDKDSIPSGWRIMDIGPKSVQKFIEQFYLSKTLIWNGPMGVFEWEKFSSGTKLLAQAIGSLNECVSVVGGGSTVEAISFFGLSDQISHVSTGGGASISFLEGSTLPGIKSLLDN